MLNIEKFQLIDSWANSAGVYLCLHPPKNDSGEQEYAPMKA